MLKFLILDLEKINTNSLGVVLSLYFELASFCNVITMCILVTKLTRHSNEANPMLPSEKYNKKLEILGYVDLEIADYIDEYASRNCSSKRSF